MRHRKPTYHAPIAGCGLERGLVAWWGMETYSGLTAYDRMRYGDGTLSGTTGQPTWAYRDEGLCTDFTAANGHRIQISDNSKFRLDTGYTLEVRFRLNSNRNFNGLVSKTNGGTAAPFDLYVPASGQPTFFSGNGTVSTSQASGSAISAGAWHTVVVAYDQIALVQRMQVDGRFPADHSTSGTTVADTTQNIRIGNRNDGATALDGQIAWVRIWNRPLSKSEMRDLWLNPWQLVAFASHTAGLPVEAGAPATFNASWVHTTSNQLIGS